MLLVVGRAAKVEEGESVGDRCHRVVSEGEGGGDRWKRRRVYFCVGGAVFYGCLSHWRGMRQLAL